MVGRKRRYFSAFLAVLLLSLSVISRAPQSKCRCHERKSARARQTQEAKPCVFGQMRSLTASFVLPSSLATDDRIKLSSLPTSQILQAQDVVIAGDFVRARARAPPALSLVTL